ncbi:hypothetical protein KJA16_02715 [Patescibacteria group bacterium]|nr:hypothetical protein [Patescibacteria group bacterium]
MADLNNFISIPLFLKILFLIISLFFLFGIIYFLLKTGWLKRLFLQDLVEFLSFKPYAIRKVSQTWKKIIKGLEKVSESETKLAIIEADDLLNEILERMGYPGETLGEKLKQLSEVILPNLDEVWKAHKIRSNIVHDPTYRLSLGEARKVLEIYEKALLKLEAI